MLLAHRQLHLKSHMLAIRAAFAGQCRSKTRVVPIGIVECQAIQAFEERVSKRTDCILAKFQHAPGHHSPSSCVSARMTG